MGQKHKRFRESRTLFPLHARHSQKSSQHVRACAAGDGAICSKNRKNVPYHRANPNTRNAARLRSPSPIMAPGLLRKFMAIKISMSLKQIAYLRTCEYSRRVSTWTASWIVFMTAMGLETKSSTLTIDICGRTICYINLSLSPRMTKFLFLLNIFIHFQGSSDENKPQQQPRNIFLMNH